MHNPKKITLTFIATVGLLLLLPFYINAQVDSTQIDRIDSTRIQYFSISFDSLYLNKLHYTDTSLFKVSNFDPLDKPYQIFATLSNAGTANKMILFKPDTKIGFDMGNKANASYLKTNSDVRFYIPLQPYSEIRYTMGGNKEQQLGVSFAREFSPRLIIGMDYNLINSPGPYLNSKTNNSSVIFSGNYTTKNNRYGLAAYYFRNKLEQQENGGILDDSLFINNIETDRRIIDVALDNANNLIKFSGFGWEQYFNLSAPPKKITDSLSPPKKKIQTGRIKHSLYYQRNQFLYTDNNPKNVFYSPFDQLLDSTKTYDSTYVQVIRNSLIWNSLSYKIQDTPPPFFLYFGAEHAAFKFSQNSLVDSTLNAEKRQYDQVAVLGGMQLNLFRSTRIFADAKLIVGGHQNGDWKLNTRWNQFIGTESKNLGDVDFRINVSSLSPDWIHNTYYSNHFRWNNELDRSRTFELEASYQIKFIRLTAGQSTIDRYIYLNKNARPQQISGTLNVRSLSAKFIFKRGKFDLNAFLYYQNPDIDSIIHMPEFGANLKFAFSQALFDNAAVLQPGFNVRWFSAYYADTYMPALRSFYIQDEIKIGNYPYIDVYLALKVKRANIFLQYANLMGLSGEFNYFTTPHYPMRDSRFYFGVSWRFYK
ncbi:MAG: putative porin [Bacteroidetes bacterium]|nr:putative porin [Bacteroidota bacterium]